MPMKRLTINRIASAALRTNRKSYVALVIGIFLSIFLVTAMCLGIHGLFMAQEARKDAAYGGQDAFWLDCEMADQPFMETGLFSEIGHVYVTAGHPDTSTFLGYYDDTAEALLSRSFIEGRMPEKPGEIALEQSALERMRLEGVGVGDELSLTLAPVDGTEETRSFTIVGILTEQSANLSSMWRDQNAQNMFPAMLVHQNEPPFATGRTVMHAVFRLAPLVTQYQALSYYFRNNVALGLSIVNGNGYVTKWPMDALQVNNDALAYSLCAALLAGSLLLATCVGISGAMEGQLSRRTEQIGMLRAVGATKKQIRRIFGREAWLLSLIVSPLSVAAGCAAAWVLSLIAPSLFIFKPALWLLLPVLALSMAVILLSSGLPLRRACAIMPMSVMRDTEMLRRMKHTRSRKVFRPASLVAWRQLSIRPTRQIGPTLLMCLIFIIISLTVNVVTTMASSALTVLQEQPSFTLRNGSSYGGNFHDPISEQRLTDGDLAQLRSLPGVKRADVEVRLVVQQELGETVPEYWKPVYVEHQSGGNTFFTNVGNGHLSLLPEAERPINSDHAPTLEAQYDAVRDVLGIEGHLGNGVDLIACIIDPADYEEHIQSGRIDMAAINAGREVIVCAPKRTAWLTADGALNTIAGDDDRIEQRLASGLYTLAARIENDAYAAGQELTLHYLYSTEYTGMYSDRTVDYYRSVYEEMSHEQVSVTVGAVVSKTYNHGQNVMILTTEQGLKNMGLAPYRITDVSIYTDDLTLEEEEALERRISAIALRGGDYVVSNLLKSGRDSQREGMMVLLLMGGVSLIFLSVCVAQISGGVSRRIRADVRMIGTLRAVGADGRVIFRCYSGQVLMSVLIGTALGLMVYWLGFVRIPYIYFPGGVWRFVTLGIQLLFAAAALGASLLILRLRIRDVTRHSIVENIREL